MNRSLLTILLVASLLLCVGCIGLWCRSLAHWEAMNYLTKAGTSYSLCTRPHRLEIRVVEHRRGLDAQGWRGHGEPKEPALADGWSLSSTRVALGPIPGLRVRETFPQWLGFGWEFTKGTMPLPAGQAVIGRQLQVAVPFWFMVVVLTAPASVYVVTRYRQHRRVELGLCSKCGYDLRASKERCPECGTPTPPLAAGIKASGR